MALESLTFKTNLHNLISDLRQVSHADEHDTFDHNFRNLPDQLASCSNDPQALLERLYQTHQYCEQHHLSSQITRKANLCIKEIEKIKAAHQDLIKNENDIVKVRLYAVLFHTSADIDGWEEIIVNGLNNPNWLQKHYFSDDENSARNSYNSDRQHKVLLCMDVNQSFFRKIGRHWAFNRTAKIAPKDVQFITIRHGSGNFNISDDYKLIEQDNKPSSPQKNVT